MPKPSSGAGDPGRDPANFGINLPSSSPYTFDGGLEHGYAFMDNARRRGGWRKWLTYVLFAVLVGPFLAMVVSWAAEALHILR